MHDYNQWRRAQMIPPALIRARWRVRSWLQEPPDACVTYQPRKDALMMNFIVTRFFPPFFAHILSA